MGDEEGEGEAKGGRRRGGGRGGGECADVIGVRVEVRALSVVEEVIAMDGNAGTAPAMLSLST